MTIDNSIALRLVQVLVPNESEIAPAIIDAYMLGGKARKRLFKSAGNVPAAFSSADIIILTPFILQAISKSGPLLLKLLTSQSVRDALSTVKTTLELVGAGQKVRESLAKNSSRVQKVLAVTDTFSAEIHVSGLNKEECDVMAVRMLQVMLENLTESEIFVQVLIERS